MKKLDIFTQLRDGGEWLAAARRWMQNNIQRGDSLGWSDATLVQVPFCKLEELALKVAVAAVEEDRRKAEESNAVHMSYLQFSALTLFLQSIKESLDVVDQTLPDGSLAKGVFEGAFQGPLGGQRDDIKALGLIQKIAANQNGGLDGTITNNNRHSSRTSAAVDLGSLV